MCKLWDRRFQRLIQQDLFMCIREAFLSTHDMRDSHLDVVNYYRKVVERMTIRTKQNQVLNFREIALLWTINNIIEARLTVSFRFHSHCQWFAGGSPPILFLFRQMSIRIP